MTMEKIMIKYFQEYQTREAAHNRKPTINGFLEAIRKILRNKNKYDENDL